MQTDYKKFLQPSVISKLANIELKAKFVVEGFIAGLHKSPYHGFSVEFAEHRQYMPGDDLKYLDWKVLGRTDRYYIKQFEEETNLKSYIIVDSSRSMQFRSSESELNSVSPLKKLFRKKEQVQSAIKSSISKLEYSTYIAASLAMLMNFQKDAAGLVVYDESVKTFIPPKATSQNLKLILNKLASIEPSGKTNTASALNLVAERIKRRGLVIIFSDLFDDQTAVINALKHFRYKRNEVIMFQVLDPAEMNFAIDSPTIFKDMETSKEMLSQPISVMNSYQDAVKEFIDNYRNACLSNNIDYVLLSTETPFDQALLGYLNKRKRLF
ncbi:MAG TPA: DUF58 domain-containing protein [Ignavibacteria bacterium]|nr:DUF58 domain-containing protein [Bacteroidota bacterium]HRF65871.1 DUF58 domain-containing protein [Ignavibacteria bacterium]HRJ04509.1 DUF58 domain-containing protein [Ignavibacteria bacterium]HRJ86311.1 DUF58 domain-containing protein [Ignavibacteria bacterium]